MRLVTFSRWGEPRLGAALGEQVVDLNWAYRALLEEAGHPRACALADALVPPDMVSFLAGGDESLQAARSALARLARGGPAGPPVAWPLAEVRLLPPLLRPGKIVCVGQNYREHILEMKREMPRYPVLFAKFASTLIGPGDPIRIPRVSRAVDYEGELAFAIGRHCRHVAEADALRYVAGYTIANDVSVRDYQARTSQFLQGKNFDASLPLGPWLVTADELDPASLELTTTVNGEVRQQASTGSMVFTVPFLVAYLSAIMTLEPGDLVLTGTPGGVGHGMQPPRYLQPGDVVRVAIAGIGVLENPVAEEGG